MSYAATTDVPVDRSKSQIEALLLHHGAQGYHTGWQAATSDDPGWDAVEFMWKGRVIRFRIPRPSVTRPDGKTSAWAKDRHGWTLSGVRLDKAREQYNRSRWRILFLVIKAKLEAVEAGVAVFEDEFLSFIVTGSGRTVGEILLPRIAAGDTLRLLEAGEPQ